MFGDARAVATSVFKMPKFVIVAEPTSDSIGNEMSFARPNPERISTES
jgi:hypothetical protein